MSELCAVCTKSEAKYKCPICLVKYCCVACYKHHQGKGDCTRKNEIVRPQGSNHNKLPETQYEFETEDTVPLEKLTHLGKNKAVLNALKNQHLCNLLRYLDTSPNPSYDIANAMAEPIFVEFVSRCLKVVDNDAGSDSSDSDSD